MTLQTCTITLAGLSLVGAKDDKGNYYIVLAALATVLNEDSTVLTRQFRTSESLKAFAGKAFDTTIRRVGRTQYKLVGVKDFSVLLMWIALQGKKEAVALLTATNAETTERRIDKALGETKTEDDYEAQTRAFYRELARKSFQPDLCSWFQSQHRINYGAEVNLFKRTLKLPLESIDSYNSANVQKWSKGITSYNALRMEGYSHTKALRAVGNQAAARD